MSSFRERPFGEVVVEIRQPFARFGMDVLMGIMTNTSEIVMASVTDTGELTYKPIERGVESKPTLHLDDNEYEALHRSFLSLPARFRGTSHLDHLADVMQQRDMLMDMISQLHTQNHEVVMKAFVS